MNKLASSLCCNSSFSALITVTISDNPALKSSTDDADPAIANSKLDVALSKALSFDSSSSALALSLAAFCISKNALVNPIAAPATEPINPPNGPNWAPKVPMIVAWEAIVAPNCKSVPDVVSKPPLISARYCDTDVTPVPIAVPYWLNESANFPILVFKNASLALLIPLASFLIPDSNLAAPPWRTLPNLLILPSTSVVDAAKLLAKSLTPDPSVSSLSKNGISLRVSLNRSLSSGEALACSISAFFALVNCSFVAMRPFVCSVNDCTESAEPVCATVFALIACTNNNVALVSVLWTATSVFSLSTLVFLASSSIAFFCLELTNLVLLRPNSCADCLVNLSVAFCRLSLNSCSVSPSLCDGTAIAARFAPRSRACCLRASNWASASALACASALALLSAAKISAPAPALPANVSTLLWAIPNFVSASVCWALASATIPVFSVLICCPISSAVNSGFAEAISLALFTIAFSTSCVALATDSARILILSIAAWYSVSNQDTLSCVLSAKSW